MAILDSKRKEINAKIVYYGPALSGKTTNIQYIHKKLRPDHRGKLMTLATQGDRTLFFDFLPVELGVIRGMKVRLQIYTVPGQVFYNATRKLVLKNVDGVIFIADSQKKMLPENIESLKNLDENLRDYHRDLKEVPLVFQYNKRDMPGVSSVDELQAALNTYGSPSFESIASQGEGVLNCLTTISKMVINKLKSTSEITTLETQREKPTDESFDEPKPPSPTPQQEQKTLESLRPSPDYQTSTVISPTEDKVKPPLKISPSTRTQPKRDELEIIELGEPEKISSNCFNIPLVIRNKRSAEEFVLDLTLKLDNLGIVTAKAVSGITSKS
ncbi:MAG: hypothetical protein JSU92_15180 [Deltaproteobacteria bacterium]|nr:MAG: hypothetical protein JSU92_15180 [Deltaproteobacteria bacterium]